jgi:hypothetical protein
MRRRTHISGESRLLGQESGRLCLGESLHGSHAQHRRPEDGARLIADKVAPRCPYLHGSPADATGPALDEVPDRRDVGGQECPADQVRDVAVRTRDIAIPFSRTFPGRSHQVSTAIQCPSNCHGMSRRVSARDWAIRGAGRQTSTLPVCSASWELVRARRARATSLRRCSRSHRRVCSSMVSMISRTVSAEVGPQLDSLLMRALSASRFDVVDGPVAHLGRGLHRVLTPAATTSGASTAPPGRCTLRRPGFTLTG